MLRGRRNIYAAHIYILAKMSESESLFVRVFHILIVGGLFFYVGTQRTDLPSQLFTGLIGLGAFIVFYHLYKAFNRIQHKKAYWINLIHILLVGPLLIYIGFFAEKTERLYFEILLMMGFAVIGYHGYYLLNY